jgi:SAM-dependent methyltransferase
MSIFPSWNPAQPEITDLVVQHDPVTLRRLPVSKQGVIDVFSRFGNQKALRAVRALPATDGWLDGEEIDALLLTVHWEMQRLAEEFYHGRRVWEVLRPLIGAIRSTGFRETLRIADVGCGIGYTTRWLAARVPLAEHNIEVIGIDLNSTLLPKPNASQLWNGCRADSYMAMRFLANIRIISICRLVSCITFEAVTLRSFCEGTNSRRRKRFCISIFSRGCWLRWVRCFFTICGCARRSHDTTECFRRRGRTMRKHSSEQYELRFPVLRREFTARRSGGRRRRACFTRLQECAANSRLNFDVRLGGTRDDSES